MATFYDLFAGIGGFRLGLERAGHRCIGSCEIDRYAREIYRKNFGEYPAEQDATRIQPENLPDFEILTAGFPCQAFSIAGKRMGFDDTRGTLFFEIARIAGQKRPKILFLENVKGLLSHNGGRTFGTILFTLDALGYDVEWQIINGKYFLPQNRERVFIIGHIRTEPWKQVFPIPEDGKTSIERQEQPKAPVARTLTAGGHSCGLHSGMTVISSGLRQSRGFETRKDGISHCVKTGGLSHSGNMVMIAALTERRTEEAKAIRKEMRKQGKDWSPRRGKQLVPRTDNLMNCLTAMQSKEHLLLQEAKIRRLTPTECERLQGFPDGWTEGASDGQRYKMLGNAVMPPVVEYVAKRIG